MKIGIDASRAYLAEKTGTEEYSYQIITHLLALPEAKKHEWILYTRDNLKLPYLWTQIGLAARTWIDHLDVLWIPAHTLPILRNPGLKTVVTIHGIEYEWLPAYENPLQKWYLPLSTEYAVKNATKLIAVSNFTKNQLVDRLHADPKKITVIHEGVDEKIVNRQSPIINKDKYILFIGTIQPRKNLVTLVKAFERIQTNTKLIIVGKNGWNYQEVLDAIATSPVKERIVIKGYIDSTERDILLRNALVYVQPSITEGFGLPILEAFAAGVPVVSSDGGALAEVVGEAGLLFDPSSLQDMKTKLEIALTSLSVRNQLIKKGKIRVKDFSWQKAAKETYNLLTSL